MDIYRYEIITPEKSVTADTPDDLIARQPGMLAHTDMAMLQQAEDVSDTQQREYALMNLTYDRYFNR